MTALRFSGPVLPDAEPRTLYVLDGRVTLDPVPGWSSHSTVPRLIADGALEPLLFR